MRAAEPDPSAPSGWRVNAWVKRGILLGFRFGETVDMSADHGRWPFFDKDTLPLQAARRRRPASASCPADRAIRDGAYLGRGVICMPPMYVNIGAYVGDETLIDSHALVGSCAQIGARVHLSAAAQIGGVIEPVGALPVIIEDDVLVGGNCGVYEGAIVKRRAVLAAGTILTGSTPIYDLPNGRIIEPAPGEPLIVPEGAVVVPGTRAGHHGRGPRVGTVGGHADHRQVPRRADQRAHGARSMDTLATVAFARAAHRHRLDDRARAGGGRVAAPRSSRRSATRRSAAASPTAASTSSRALDRPAVVLSTHFDCVPPFFPSDVRDGRLYGRGACDAKGILAAQVAAAERMRARGERRVGLLFVVGEERGSDGAARGERRAAPGSAFLINGEPTDNRLGLATRGVLRVRLTAPRPRRALGCARARRVGDRQAARCAGPDAHRCRWPSDPELGTTFYTLGLIEGGIAPNVISPSRVRGGDVPHRRLAGRGAATATRRWSRPCAIEEVLRVPMVRLHTVAGFAVGGVPLHDRHSVPRSLGHAAAVRSRLVPGRAHRPRSTSR